MTQYQSITINAVGLIGCCYRKSASLPRRMQEHGVLAPGSVKGCQDDPVARRRSSYGYLLSQNWYLPAQQGPHNSITSFGERHWKWCLFLAWWCWHLSATKESLLPTRVFVWRPTRAAFGYVGVDPHVSKASLLPIIPRLSRPRDWRSAMFGLLVRDWYSIFQEHMYRTTPWCPYWAANESCVRLYFVAAFLGLNSSIPEASSLAPYALS